MPERWFALSPRTRLPDMTRERCCADFCQEPCRWRRPTRIALMDLVWHVTSGSRTCKLPFTRGQTAHSFALFLGPYRKHNSSGRAGQFYCDSALLVLWTRHRWMIR